MLIVERDGYPLHNSFNISYVFETFRNKMPKNKPTWKSLVLREKRQELWEERSLHPFHSPCYIWELLELVGGGNAEKLSGEVTFTPDMQPVPRENWTGKILFYNPNPSDSN